MTRSWFRPMAFVGLVAALLFDAGCSKPSGTDKKGAVTVDAKSGAPDEGAGSTGKPEKAGTSPKEEPKFISDWSAKPPAAIILLSGEQNGYPDPCGCTDGQLGGLGRRFHLCEMIQAKGWPMVKIDLGNLIRFRSDTSRGGPKQEKIKFDVILEALGMMNYDAVALGAEDLRLGVMETLATLLNSQPPKYPVFLAANVKPQAGLETTLASIKFTKAGPVKIAITSVIDPSEFEQIQDADLSALKVVPPDEVIPAVLEDMKKLSQVKILMVQGPFEDAKRLAEKFPGFDLVVGTSEFEDPDEHAETVNDGKTLLVRNIGKKGKYAGLVGIFPGASPQLEFRRQPLDERHFTPSEPMRKHIDFDYQDRLKRARIVEEFTRNATTPAGAKFLGAESCQKCHPKTFEKWTTTKHAKAYEALDNWKRPRTFDAECISCHTTGFGFKTGWVSAEVTPLLKGNQCENCHGPGSLHSADPDNTEFRKPMHMTKQMADATNFCTKCHDTDNDHNFNFENRYAQIFHKGLDDYTDPKVHQKTPPK